MTTDTAKQLAAAFGKGVDQHWELHRLGSGHIHHTYVLRAGEDRLIVQRVNTHVFQQPQALMQNQVLIESHCRLHEETFRSAGMQYLKSAGGEWLEDGNYLWRAFQEVENSYTMDVPRSAEYAYRGAYGFGIFLKVLSDMNPAQLSETIPFFHDGRMRLEQYLHAHQSASVERKKKAAEVIGMMEEFREVLQEVPQWLADGTLPLRVAHNDTKINNILFHENSGEALCVIDLDTVMPGTWLYDFGDMVRTFTPLSAEDEPDAYKVRISKEYLLALADGFMDALGSSLSQVEKEKLPIAGPYMCAIIGIRFLTDYLAGDTYFPTKYPEHNLIRARNQFLAAIELKEHKPQLLKHLNSKTKLQPSGQ